ncbi:MAG: 30S ribosomal protein S17 [bacterium]
MTSQATTTEQVKNTRQRKTGTVVSNKMDKTIVVEVSYRKAHPKYKKIVATKSKFYVHDKNSKAVVGDTVIIEETRPLSKLKRWRLVEIVQ